MRSSENAAYQQLIRERDEAEGEYMNLLRNMPPVCDRTPQDRVIIDRALSKRLKASYAVWHYGIL